MELDYYCSDDFSPEFYIKLAQAGFISTTMIYKKVPLLLPEIQCEYAILDFKDLHISKKVKKLLAQKNYDLLINRNLEKVLDNIEKYHKESWIIEEYRQMLIKLKDYDKDENFELLSVELFDKEADKLIAGEIGYKIGKTYTSLTGFFKRNKKYDNWGKLQLVLLAQYLQKNNYDFWNLGHACLKYKIDLGAKVYKRSDFLNRWKKSIL